jgi:carboxyl-terminal processing protease
MEPFRATIALLSVLGALLVGIWLGGHPGTLPSALRDAFVDEDQALRAEVIDAIEDNYYKPVDEDKLEQASLKGMVRSLGDRFSHYFTPEEARLFAQSVRGSFEGIGTTVEEDRRGLRILQVFASSPAKRAGIQRGDIITKVGDDPLAGESSEIATAKIKGKAGSKVTLTILTPATKRTRTVTLERARVKVPVVESRTMTRGGRRVGVIKLISFTNGSHGELRKEVDRLLEGGAKGLVLDLRGNGGGLLDEAVLVASIFVEDGTIVSTRARKRPEDTREATGDAIDTKVPLVVLVDRDSASASEIVAGAIRDRKRGKVVGTRTFGKGLVQTLVPLSNDGALDITIGSYHLPSGRPVTDRGVTPEVEARDNPRTRRDEALPVALEALPG